MRFEHGSHRTECLAALIVLLLPLLCCTSYSSSASADDECRRTEPPFRDDDESRQCLPRDDAADAGCGARGRLRFCDAYAPARLLLGACDAQGLARLRRLDDEARAAAQRFAGLLRRYDCENANSVSWTCKDCEEAYKQWVCAMFLPRLQVEGEGLKPCRYVCRLVEQRCPYFHPSVKEQYAGERVFKCIDPDIPDLDGIQGDSSYGPPHRCYCPQHVEGGPDSGEAECHLLSPAQLLRRNASRWGQHRSGVDRAALEPPTLLLATALLAAAWWTTRTR